MGAAPAAAQEAQPWRVEELRVAGGPAWQHSAVVAGDWVAWVEQPDPGRRHARARNLRTGQEVALSRHVAEGPAIAGDALVVVEGNELVAHRLPGLERSVIASAPTDFRVQRQGLSAHGSRIAWVQGALTRGALVQPIEVMTHDLGSNETRRLASTGSSFALTAVSDRLVAWADERHGGGARDVYAIDLASGREVRVTPRPESVGAVAATGTRVVWSAVRDRVAHILVFDTATGQERELARLPGRCAGAPRVAADGEVVVWTEGEMYDEASCAGSRPTVRAHDLRSGATFLVSRAIGEQARPSISGHRVVWTDQRNGSTGWLGFDQDVFGATLQPIPGPLPPRVGAPVAADARIEIVWPHGGAPVADASRANLDVWLFEPGTLRPGRCQWSPPVRVWRAVDNEPAAPVGFGRIEGNRFEAHGRMLPTWYVNDLDVGPAREPGRRVFFFASVEGVSSRTNVWAHAADARTHFPAQDVPTGVAPTAGPLDARIEIVWPHGGAPVDRAERVNVTAALFAAGTLRSAAPEHDAIVRLWRSLNQRAGEEVGVGRKRLTSAGGLIYPVWDFDDVDVSAARDPANKHFFRLTVDGADARSNVWAHGADGRSVFPRLDEPTAACSVPG